MLLKASFMILFISSCFLAALAGAGEASDMLLSAGAAHDIDQRSDLIEDNIEDAAYGKKDSLQERSLEQKAEYLETKMDMMKSSRERESR